MGDGQPERSVDERARTCCRAGSTCRIASTTSTAPSAWPASARSSRAHVSRTLRARRVADARRRRRPRSSRSRRRWRACTPRAPTRSTCSKANNPWRARRVPAAGAGPRLGRVPVRRAGSIAAPVIVVWHPSADARPVGTRAQRAARVLEALADVSRRSIATPPCCPRRSWRRASRFTAKC